MKFHAARSIDSIMSGPAHPGGMEDATTLDGTVSWSSNNGDRRGREDMPSERVTGGEEKGCMRNNWKTYFFSPIPKDGQVVAALPSILMLSWRM